MFLYSFCLPLLTNLGGRLADHHQTLQHFDTFWNHNEMFQLPSKRLCLIVCMCTCVFYCLVYPRVSQRWSHLARDLWIHQGLAGHVTTGRDVTVVLVTAGAWDVTWQSVIASWQRRLLSWRRHGVVLWWRHFSLLRVQRVMALTSSAVRVVFFTFQIFAQHYC